MGIVNNALAGASGNQGYFIQRSLRFRSSASAYLSRTPSSTGNRNKFTYSGWVKRGIIDTGSSAQYPLISAGGNGGDCIMFSNGNLLSCQIGQQGITAGRISNNTYRDPSAWYHIVISVDTTQATAGNRVLMWVNNQEITSFAFNNLPSQNYNFVFNTAGTANTIGRQPSDGNFFDGYLAEVNFIDGQALPPSSFGQTDATTGVWVPKKYTGTYGTNGFYLDFKNNTSATTLAYDKSGNGNNWTPNNISTTAGATYDSMTDVPTLTSATASNFAVINPLYPPAVASGAVRGLSDGNLTVFNAGASNWTAVGSAFVMASGSGKWYWEVTMTGTVSNGTRVGIHKALTSATFPSALLGYTGDADGYAYAEDGTKYNNQGTGTAYGASFTNNDIIGVALDCSTAGSASLTFYKNGVSQGVAYTGLSGDFIAATSNAQAVTQYFNFGQKPWGYTPPTGFKALNTFNLPDPTIKKPNQYMDATTYTGTNAAQNITNSGSFQPDMVWVKGRNVAASHNLFDSVRGPRIHLASNLTDAEYAEAAGVSLTAFNSNGFALGTDNAGSGQVNANGNTYVGWQWKKGATPGFDIVTFTSPASGNFTVNHSLGVTPAMVIVKTRDTAGWNWHVWHKSLASATNSVLVLNSTAAVNSSFNMWGAAGATSTTIGITTGNPVPANSACVAYLFAEIPQFSKFGSYTGNGSTDGPFVYCGFRPKYVMVKSADAATYGQWRIWDTTRSPYNAIDKGLQANTSDAEYTEVQLDAVSNGFKIRGTFSGLNASGQNLIYAAFAENPFKYSNAR